MSELYYWLYLNKILFAPLSAFLTAQLLKGLLASLKSKKWHWERFIEAGGMPSSHSAMVTALATAAGLSYGWSSSLFTITAIFSVIVMYDAMGVRRAAGIHAKILNQILEEMGRQDGQQNVKALKELIGHTPSEVVAGAVIGVIMASVVF
ncbi:acid phosphatase [Desulforamulus profundi]|uniref:Acid phosphatase n=1 Tax=Desulforamulus profundi TaxID=1383067 RepID=A0A2C6MGF5_9FIRM|nr:divergent PAP2 family protein [Desulforamulus profundi]MCL4440642.1 divergent PAP2 family protein [Bacillota bacterium]MCL5780330.1 divergent PAP2 family protein [Bacillota bacterium]PHJ38792.1 acid phosphatase [Desulforamulus profundi]